MMYTDNDEEKETRLKVRTATTMGIKQKLKSGEKLTNPEHDFLRNHAKMFADIHFTRRKTDDDKL